MKNNIKKVYITVGISASGKSTWAKNFIAEDKAKFNLEDSWGYGGCWEINRDDIRLKELHGRDITWAEYKFNRTNENKVTEIAIEKFNEAVEIGIENIIISDTNLNKKFRDQWIERAESVGYEVVIVEFPITFEEACRRNELRYNGVPRSAIAKQWEQWNEYIGRKTYEPDTSKSKAIIVDIDGTIAERVDRGAFEWDKVGQDKPRSFVIDIIRRYIEYYVDDQIIFVSGRDSVCKHETLTWIARHMNIPIYNIMLHMRREGDMRKDYIVKEEIFWDHIADNYNVIAAFDDRPQVVNLWHDIKIPNVIVVADQRHEF